MLKKVQCGCGKHYVREGGDSREWNGRWWKVDCLIERLENEITALNDNKKVIRKFKCPSCRLPLGKRYVVHGDNFYHADCLADIGGEG